MNGAVVESESSGVGMRLNVPGEVWEADDFCWVLKSRTEKIAENRAGCVYRTERN
jgi:hypothetical protein